MQVESRYYYYDVEQLIDSLIRQNSGRSTVLRGKYYQYNITIGVGRESEEEGGQPIWCLKEIQNNSGKKLIRVGVAYSKADVETQVNRALSKINEANKQKKLANGSQKT